MMIRRNPIKTSRQIKPKGALSNYSASVFFRGRLALLLSLLFSFTANASSENPLKNHPSAYLAMHTDDPVDWHLWNESSRKQAKQEDKLILLSSGYFACHWCHVMQAENYRNSLIAAQINRDFIAVKIDRELSPELDASMIEFARRYAGRAGWPQHIILTPQGMPFLAFGYLPPQQLQALLQRTLAYWHSNRQQIEQLAQSALHPHKSTASTWDQRAFKEQFFKTLRQNIDDLSGGLKGTHKFPRSPLLLALLQQTQLDMDIEDWLLLTLEQMQNQHLFDHVDGGFYRYCVDPEWQTPHFEKMAYDNTLLAQVYLLAAQRWRRQDFLNTAEQTLAYLHNRLHQPQLKLYLGSQSALDNAGNEGGNYLWSKEKLKEALPQTLYKIVASEWRLNLSPPYELGWHPRPTSRNWPQIHQHLQTHSTQAATDDKALISWNALALIAWRQAEQLFRSDWIKDLKDFKHHYPYIAQAQEYASTLKQALRRLVDRNNLPRAITLQDDAELAVGQAGLQEYAYLYQAFAGTDSQRQNRLGTQINADFVSRNQQGIAWNLGDSESRLVSKMIYAWADETLPNPTAWLHCLQPDIIDAASQEIMQNPLQYASYLSLNSCPTGQKNIQ